MLHNLARKSARCPKSFLLTGIKRIGVDPVAKGGFGEIYKGVIRGHAVAIKALKVYTQSDPKVRTDSSIYTVHDINERNRISSFTVKQLYGDIYAMLMCCHFTEYFT